MELSLGIKLILSLVLGAVIGLERESYERKIDKIPADTISGRVGSLGVRSYALITTLGTIAGLLYNDNYGLFLIISIAFMMLLISYYIIGSLQTKDNGITTELAIIFSYLIGFFIAIDFFPTQLIIAMVIILVGILNIKERLQIIISGIKQSEISAFLSFAIVALVIFPFLPNKSYSLSNIPYLTEIMSSFGINIERILNLNLFNPFNIWKVVVIITGVDIFGYILEKTVGQKKGWLFTVLAGGFISSTSTTQSIALKSKSSSESNRLTASAIFANFSSFIQHSILIISVNSAFFVKSSLYVLSILFSSFLIGNYFLNKEDKNSIDNLNETKEKLKEDKIFSLGPALKFAAIFLTVTVITKISLELFGDSGFLITAVLASATGLDATTINISQLAGTSISYSTAVLALILANSFNLLFKSFYGFSQGSKSFAKRFLVSVIIITIVSFIGLLPLL
jgi:uncharacterized membrane protein (DUF4010 family)